MKQTTRLSHLLPPLAILSTVACVLPSLPVMAQATAIPKNAAASPNVPSDHWAYDAVAKFKKAGIMQDLPNTATRDDFARVISRLMDKLPAVPPDFVTAKGNSKNTPKFANREEVTALRLLVVEFLSELERQGQNKKNLDDKINALYVSVRPPEIEIPRLRVRNAQPMSPPLNRALLATLAAEKPTILLGEPVRLYFVVHNSSTANLQTFARNDRGNSLGRPESFTVTVLDEAGKSVPQPVLGIFRTGGISSLETISARGNYTFSLFLPHWATFEKPGTYSVVVRRTLRVGLYNTPVTAPMSSVPLEARATITVAPADTEKMGQVITALGNVLRTATKNDPDDVAADAALSLRYIDDERVIPEFVRVFNERRDDTRFAGLNRGALDKYNNEAAFEVLRKAMDIKGADMMREDSSLESARVVAEQVRFNAALALANSPHPGAFPFLLTRRHDTSIGVRITVLHELGKRGKQSPETVIPILREMSLDKDKGVSDEAKRYLALLAPAS